ncbi:MAG: alpha/beta hydrolase [Solirubrobacterales bacterium]|nr:alpha/beta hydrolase [Solirubrobacterales bacterium]HRV60464.1 alpha/beta hydrolase [Solirubrobacterales bacterium]
MSEFTPFHRGGSGEPLVLIHGFTGTWEMWDLVIAPLEEKYDVFIPTLPMHAGGPEIEGEASVDLLIEGTETLLDEVGIETAHLVGNSLGGYAALRLAANGRARTVNALAPAGGWAEGDPVIDQTMDFFQEMIPLVAAAAEHVDDAVATPEGRAMLLQFLTEHPEVVSPELSKKILLGGAGCTEALALAEMGRTTDWSFDYDAIDCPTRIVWGTEDKVLGWPVAAARFQEGLSDADWIILEGIGHCPMLDVPEKTVELITEFARD